MLTVPIYVLPFTLIAIELILAAAGLEGTIWLRACICSKRAEESRQALKLFNSDGTHHPDKAVQTIWLSIELPLGRERNHEARRAFISVGQAAAAACVHSSSSCISDIRMASTPLKRHAFLVAPDINAHLGWILVPEYHLSAKCHLWTPSGGDIFDVRWHFGKCKLSRAVARRRRTSGASDRRGWMQERQI